MLPLVDEMEANISLPFQKTRAVKQETTRERLLVRTTARAEHQWGRITLDSDRIHHVPGLGSPREQT